uniref:Photosystem II reaction center protein Psb30 n=2 Tax=Caloglossa TaxID=31388 RepID=A0A1Z1M656_9FLOR|nr:photosystem II protein psb30 [Caloglossa monosticha]YP_009392830.1 photosystem II protein psb30 [Caloglossa intermedia]ARW60985.1 photosystem II protein psb30 [Caloglossa monosticha]ARW61392.1 photosystem II protein psb30 [Caloglossa intermedia]
MINWQVLGQLISLGIIVLVGPAVIVLLYLKKSNL